jgi:hypothetical protein
MIIPAEGEIMKHRETGNIFKIKKITKDFVILFSLEGPTQIMTGPRSLVHLFEKINGVGHPSSQEIQF